MINALLAGLFTIIGIIIGQYLPRKSAIESDIWRKRDKTYNMLTYATDLILTRKPMSISIGIYYLEELLNTEMLQEEDKQIVYRIYSKILKEVKNNNENN